MFWDAYLGRLGNLFNENPLVPIGCILTTTALARAVYVLGKGNSRQLQRAFRARVTFQAATLASLFLVTPMISKWRNDRKQKAEAELAAMYEDA